MKNKMFIINSKVYEHLLSNIMNESLIREKQKMINETTIIPTLLNRTRSHTGFLLKY